MATANSNKLKKRFKTMAAKKRRKRTVHRAPAVRRRRTTTAKRRKRTLSAGAPAKRKVGVMEALKTTGGGAIGGGIYVAPQFLFKMPWYVKLLYAGSTSVVASMLKQKNIGAGIAGGFTADMAKTNFAVGLKDDLEDTDYVDADTLSDTGFCDENGNEVVMDDNGTIYSLQDDGSYEAIGSAEDLQDDMQSQSQVPLANDYALQDVYALSDPRNY